MTAKNWTGDRLPRVDVLFILLGLAGLVLGLVALAKGSLDRLHIANRKAGAGLLGASVVALLVGGALAPNDTSRTSGSPEPSQSPAGDDDFSLEVPTSLASPARPSGGPTEAQSATVVRHVDGDTLWLEGGTLPPNAASSVRLLEIDAPEVGTAYSTEATNFLKQELPIGATVYLLADRGDTDRFGRYLRYLWRANGEFFNEKIVRQGLARAVLIAPNDRYITVIRAAEAEARAALRGIWSASGSSATTSTAPPRAPTTLRVPTTAPPRITTPTTRAASNCHPSYPDFCIPPPPPDLDCGDIQRSFTVRQPDPHGFDGRPGQPGEPDGVSCESYN
jgi:micrococcal nuclease